LEGRRHEERGEKEKTKEHKGEGNYERKKWENRMGRGERCKGCRKNNIVTIKFVACFPYLKKIIKEAYGITLLSVCVRVSLSACLCNPLIFFQFFMRSV
jgi:hypothetical protein